MAKPKYPKEFLELCASITGKRPKTVIDHILKHGHITTEELKNKYGYDHPPRAARDVRELGIQLETFRVEAANGRKAGRDHKAPTQSAQGIVVAVQSQCFSGGSFSGGIDAAGRPWPRTTRITVEPGRSCNTELVRIKSCRPKRRPWADCRPQAAAQRTSALDRATP